MEKEEEKYTVKTWEDLLNVVNKENFERLSIDLLQWLGYYAVHIQTIRDAYPKETEGKSNTEITTGDFTWIDDGKHDVKYVEITNKNTGETKRYE